MSLECEFCETKFIGKSALKNHQKTAKYCLIKRGKIVIVEVDQEPKEVIFECKYCNKKLASKQNLNIHLQSCIPKYEFLLKEKEDENETLKIKVKTIENEVIKLEEYKQQIKELQDKIERMTMRAIEKPTTTNNLILSPIDLSQEHISKVIAEKFTKEHFYDGQAGVARFAFDNILKDKDGKLAYVCTDVARHIFKHVDENGEIVKDVRASKLTKKLTADVKKMSGQIVIKKTKEEEEAKVNCSFFLTKKMEEIAAIDQDNSKFRIELANLTVEK